ncbi:MAG: glycerophosphodiester phosphodiesterase family protein [Vicinamibacteraceae bacterium]
MRIALVLSAAMVVAGATVDVPAATRFMMPPSSSPWLVAHRGASAYAPEHTIAAYTLALEQGADYVEQDLTLTRDGVLVCLHDDTLERTTDVETRFPDRAVAETGAGGSPVKRWYANDFTLAELKTLDAGSWFDARFAGERVPTFEEAIALVKGRAGIFPELKSPARLNARGVDVEQAVAAVLAKHGLIDAQVKGRPAVYLQSFEEKSVRRLATLLPAVPRALLIGAKDAARWLTADGLREAKTFATAIGPARALIEARPAVVAEAHAAGLAVVPYTFRAARDAAAPARDAVRDEMRRFIAERGVDGLFTDNPDLFPR